MMPHVPAANRPSLLKNPPGRPVALVAAGPQDLGAQQRDLFLPPPAEHFSVVVCLFHHTGFYLPYMVTMFF